MKVTPSTYQRKDGRSAVIRQAQESDAEQMLKMARQCASETRNLCSTESEYDLPVEAEMKWIIDRNGEGCLLQVVEVDGELKGNCMTYPQGGRLRVRHRCGVGIGLLKEIWGNGIGTLMMQNAIDFAKEYGYEQMELDVVSTNETAVHLYEKLDFVRYGLHPHAFRYEDGSYADLLLMALDLR